MAVAAKKITDPLPRVDCNLYCDECGAFMMVPTHPGVVLCPNGHGKSKPYSLHVYRVHERIHRILPWLKSFGVAEETEDGFVIEGHAGLFRRRKRILPDLEHPPEGEFGGRIGDQVYCFTKKIRGQEGSEE